MSAYFIAMPEQLSDFDALQRYAASAPAVVEAFDGKYLVGRGAPEALEGSWDPGFMAIIEFPSMARLKEFYESEDYRPWRELRERAATTSILVVDA